ncbi:Poxvirus protein I5 [Promicromonospora sp. NPDC060204]|uniref:Poxvirus protein I5 n=1 Tax=Promicromonospora sp. NPDC060204 TaxID=3347071 RepID=UPI0036466FA4
MSAQEQADEPAAPARGRRLAGEGWFPLLGETLLTGLLVLAGSLAVVTAPAALAAGAAHLRRHLGGYDTSVRSFWRDWVAAVRGLWVLGVLVLGVAVVVVVNSGLTASGALPGAAAVRWVTWAAAACAAVVLVRTTAAWSDGGAGTDSSAGSAAGAGAESGPGADGGAALGAGAGSAAGAGNGADDGSAVGAGAVWRLLARGAARSRDDLVGSALLLAALVMCVVLVWMLTPLVVVTGGLLSLAAVAVETRRALPRPVN